MFYDTSCIYTEESTPAPGTNYIYLFNQINKMRLGFVSFSPACKYQHYFAGCKLLESKKRDEISFWMDSLPFVSNLTW